MWNNIRLAGALGIIALGLSSACGKRGTMRTAPSIAELPCFSKDFAAATNITGVRFVEKRGISFCNVVFSGKCGESELKAFCSQHRLKLTISAGDLPFAEMGGEDLGTIRTNFPSNSFLGIGESKSARYVAIIWDPSSGECSGIFSR